MTQAEMFAWLSGELSTGRLTETQYKRIWAYVTTHESEVPLPPELVERIWQWVLHSVTRK